MRFPIAFTYVNSNQTTQKESKIKMFLVMRTIFARKILAKK